MSWITDVKWSPDCSHQDQQKILKVAVSFCTISSNFVCFVYKGKEVLITKNVLVWVLLHSSYKPNTQCAMIILIYLRIIFCMALKVFHFHSMIFLVQHSKGYIALLVVW
jgi:hypothetical protein